MITVRDAIPSDVPRVCALCDAYMGAGFYTEEDFLEMIRDEDQFLLVAVNGEDIPVAFLFSFVGSFEKAKKTLLIPDGFPGLERYTDMETVGVFKTTVTDPAYRRQGILASLMRASRNILHAHGAEVILLDALKLPSGEIPAAGGIEKMKFTRVGELVRPWRDIPFSCPYCGSPSCLCNAVICVKEI